MAQHPDLQPYNPNRDGIPRNPISARDGRRLEEVLADDFGLMVRDFSMSGAHDEWPTLQVDLVMTHIYVPPAKPANPSPRIISGGNS